MCMYLGLSLLTVLTSAIKTFAMTSTCVLVAMDVVTSGTSETAVSSPG